MATAAPGGDHLVVTAIDFGTTYSGYAFSFKHDPTKVQTNQGWNAGSERLISYKTPTCVLVNPQKKFDSFGYDAENKYVSLVDEEKHEGWMLFRRFKMILHNEEGLTRKAKVEDINGKKMLAMDVFTMAIRYMREHLMNALKKQVSDIQQSDVLFVITVPAIWSDASKQFMREAAIAGGIDTSHIKIALEPEAASIWCQHENSDKKTVFNKTGSKYMVVDLGGTLVKLTDVNGVTRERVENITNQPHIFAFKFSGGTVDFSVHERNFDGTLKELHRPSGGPWGGTCVDDRYIAWLTELFGAATMEQFKAESMGDFIDVLRDFETKKRSVLTATTGMITFRIPAALKECNEESGDEQIVTKIARLNLKEDVKIKRDKLNVAADIVRSWFEESIYNTVRHVSTVLSEPAMKDVNTILLVGGYGECQLVQDAIGKAVGKRTVLVPEDAGLAVLKGAVKFGHQPRLVKSRCMKYTYGISMSDYFDESKHPKERIEIDSYGRQIIRHCFKKIIELGSSVEMFTECKLPTMCLNRIENTWIKVFRSTSPSPVYTTDQSCSPIGSLVVEKTPWEKQDDNAVEISFSFGDTELKASVKIIKTGEVHTKIIDCL